MRGSKGSREKRHSRGEQRGYKSKIESYREVYRRLWTYTVCVWFNTVFFFCVVESSQGTNEEIFGSTKERVGREKDTI